MSLKDKNRSLTTRKVLRPLLVLFIVATAIVIGLLARRRSPQPVASSPPRRHGVPAPLSFAALVVLCFATGRFAAAGAVADVAVDAVFARYSASDRPGCALAVEKSGRVLYARGYGTANLEAAIPITPGTIFDIGSVSKQFTAMAVVLLIEDGRLALDDDIRKYLPEIPDYGARITIGHLLHHTSGLRNYTDLFDLAGVPEVDLTTSRDALELIARQRGINFRPGDEFLYSDTNYFLAGEIVRRVSGESLRQFSEERIFRPLGMSHTHISDQPREVVRGRAIGYEPIANGYLNYLSNFEQVGDGSVLTTVLDLARWQRNFEVPRVGGKRGIELLLGTTALNDGSRPFYALGVFVDGYRGLRWIHHDGEWVGYRAAVSYYPSQQLSVIVACNVIGDLNAMELAQRVADHYLGAAAGPPAAIPRDADSGARVGLYWSLERGSLRRISAQDGVLMLGEGEEAEALRPDGQGGYRDPDAEAMTSYRFRAAKGSEPARLEARSFGGTVEFVRVAEAADHVLPLDDYVGRYVTPDLPGRWELVVDGGKLVRRQRYQHDSALTPLFADTFSGVLSEGEFVLHFVRDDNGHVTGLRVSSEGLRPMSLAKERTDSPAASH